MLLLCLSLLASPSRASTLQAGGQTLQAPQAMYQADPDLLPLIDEEDPAHSHHTSESDGLASFLAATKTTKLDLRTAKGQTAKIQMGQGANQYVMEVTKTGKFAIVADQKAMLAITPEGEVRIDAAKIAAQSMSVRSFSVREVPQWALYAFEMFTPSQETSWSVEERIQCMGLTIMGQYPAESASALGGAAAAQPDMNYTKSFSDLPKHKSVRIKATVHFLDDWMGETAYLKIDDNYVWTMSHNQRNSKSAISICGKDRYPESKFSVPIDITIPHELSSMKATFGSTLRSDQAMFGISSFEIYMRKPRKAKK